MRFSFICWWYIWEEYIQWTDFDCSCKGCRYMYKLSFLFFSFCLTRCSGTLLYFIGFNNLCNAWLFTQKWIVETTIYMPNENVSKYCQGFITLFIMFNIVSWKIIFSSGWKSFVYKISHTYFIHAYLIWQYLN